MKVIILAGGKGTRLPLSAKNIPKPLVTVHEKTILDYHIDILKSFGFSDIRLSLGHMADKIIDHVKKRYGNFCEWIVEPEKLGTGGALKYASSDLKKDFLAFNVDDFPEIDMLDFVESHINRNIENTIAIYKVENAQDFGLIKHRCGYVEEFLEKPETSVPGYINTGFYILNPSIFKEISESSFSIEKDVFPVLAKTRRLACYSNVRHWFTTGTEERLAEAHEYLKRYL